ncbi:DUF397 domain-containing protein [Streptomyces abyssalis]|uniref:DUF397 domain-containing protein n=1 Tax=Streptomyces abyssalis TaxID=933944 RepID=UPI0009A037A5
MLTASFSRTYPAGHGRRLTPRHGALHRAATPGCGHSGSKVPDGPALVFPAGSWAAFVGAVSGGAFRCR